jgi:hypothetical protein
MYKISRNLSGTSLEDELVLEKEYPTEAEAIKELAIKACDEGLTDLDVAIRERQFSVYRGDITYTYKIIRV